MGGDGKTTGDEPIATADTENPPGEGAASADVQKAQGEQGPIVAPVEFTIGEYKVRLKAPASFIVCREIMRAAAINEERAYYAALGACWKGKGKPKVRYNYDPLKYGGLIFDNLAQRGIGPDAVGTAAFWAMFHIAQQAKMMPTKDEVDDAVGFSNAGDR